MAGHCREEPPEPPADDPLAPVSRSKAASDRLGGKCNTNPPAPASPCLTGEA
jgi:hypothetical protein